MAIHINGNVCKGCGLCVYYCPKQVLRLSNVINIRGYPVAEVMNYEACIHCRQCEFGCPDLAIYVTPKAADKKEEKKDSGN